IDAGWMLLLVLLIPVAFPLVALAFIAPADSACTIDNVCQPAARAGMTGMTASLHFEGDGGHLVPVGDRIVVPADEAQASVLGGDYRQRVADGVAEPVGRSMPCADAIGSDRVPLRPGQIV